MSSTLQNEKTKYDVKSLGNDVKNHVEIAGEKLKTGLHKTGVALGVTQPTTGEQVGKGIEKTIDVVSGQRKVI